MYSFIVKYIKEICNVLYVPLLMGVNGERTPRYVLTNLKLNNKRSVCEANNKIVTNKGQAVHR